MGIEQNRALAVRFVKRMKECRGIDEELVTGDFRWWSSGIGFMDMSRMKQLLATLDAVMPQMPDMTIQATTAEADRVAVEAIGACDLANGKRYENTYHFLFFIRHGRICLLKEYLDSRLAAEVLGAEPQPHTTT